MDLASVLTVFQHRVFHLLVDGVCCQVTGKEGYFPNSISP